MADFTVEHWPLDRLQANPDNYRHHPEAQVAQLQKSLQQFGVFKNVVATPEGLVLAGHGVVAAAMQEGLDTLPVYVFTGSEDEQRKLMVADNELSRLAADDAEQLSQLLVAINADGGLEGTGFDEASLDELLAEVDAMNPPTGYVEPANTLQSRFGAPPFSVFDARQGYWQERKRSWIAWGIQSELGRGGAPGGSPRPAARLTASGHTQTGEAGHCEQEANGASLYVGGGRGLE
jgi:hypothetical protein